MRTGDGLLIWRWNCGKECDLDSQGRCVEGGRDATEVWAFQAPDGGAEGIIDGNYVLGTPGKKKE